MMAVEGRWTVNAMEPGFGPNASMGGLMPRRDAFPIPVVPCDDAAVERAAKAMAEARWATWLTACPLRWEHVTESNRESWREDVRRIIRALAGLDPSAGGQDG